MAFGFIDINSHTDWFLVFNLKSDSNLGQGVTTELNGVGGLSGGLIPVKIYEGLLPTSSFVCLTNVCSVPTKRKKD
jgi:N-acyl-D-aspartate/D-glutamate deacylase